MKIVRDPLFDQYLADILDFIATDSLENALTFLDELEEKINQIHYPYMYRKSYFYSDEKVRDLIFKGYVVPYLVDKERNQLVILDIFKYIDKKVRS